MIFRSILFVPGDRPDRFEKAAASGADAICIDLEDAVKPADKAQARSDTVAFIERRADAGRNIFVRINALETEMAQDDLDALLKNYAALAGLLVPKADDPGAIETVARRLSDTAHGAVVVPLIESAAGLRLAFEIASVRPVHALSFGPLDFAASLGAQPETALLNPVRLQIRLCAGAAGKSVIDGPCVRLDDEKALKNETDFAAALGFEGKLAIHPNQIGVVNEGFTPTPEQIEADRRLLERAENSDGVFVAEGTLVDEPVLAAARRRLALAERLAKIGTR